jgi:hypothetical protein
MDHAKADNYSLEFCHELLDESRLHQIADFLQTDGAIPEAEAAAVRAGRSGVLAYDSRGALVGQLSLEARNVEQLGNRFWYIAVYISPDQRGGDLGRRMTLLARQRLEAQFLAGVNPDIIGVFLVVQSRAYKSGRDQAVTPVGGIFIGRNRRGDNMRVFYFEGACIDGGPAQPKRAPLEPRLPSRYRLEIVREKLDEALLGEVATFLSSLGAVKDPDRARERAGQTVALAYDGGGNIVGQHCVERRHVPQLLNEFWYVSVFVSGDHRRAHLARHLNLLGQSWLEQRFLEGDEPDVIGLYYRMQSPRLKASDRRAISYYSGLAFIGRNRRGESLRVYYFSEALITRGLTGTNTQK